MHALPEIKMLRTASQVAKPCLGRRSSVAIARNGATTTTKASTRGLAAHAESHGGDHHHDAAHHHRPPPMPPFARLPVPSQKLYEQNDAVFDDGVAPELALDFDCQHISSREALATWFGAFGVLYAVYILITWYDPRRNQPGLNQGDFIVQQLPYGLSNTATLHAVFPNEVGGHDSHGHEGDDNDEEEEDED